VLQDAELPTCMPIVGYCFGVCKDVRLNLAIAGIRVNFVLQFPAARRERLASEGSGFLAYSAPGRHRLTGWVDKNRTG
jgi:hypothetical protein